MSEILSTISMSQAAARSVSEGLTPPADRRWPASRGRRADPPLEIGELVQVLGDELGQGLSYGPAVLSLKGARWRPSANLDSHVRIHHDVARENVVARQHNTSGLQGNLNRPAELAFDNAQRGVGL